MKANWTKQLALAALASATCLLGGCGGTTGSAGMPASTERSEKALAQQFVAQLERCFAREVNERVVTDAAGAVIALGRECDALVAAGQAAEAILRRYGDLLADPSMTGVSFAVQSASLRKIGDAERLDVTLRYFRSNGAPYELTESLAVRADGSLAIADAAPR